MLGVFKRSSLRNLVQKVGSWLPFLMDLVLPEGDGPCGTPRKCRTHGIGLSPYRLQISRMVDGVKPERTDCGNVSRDEKLKYMRLLQFCNHSWDGGSRPNAP